MPDSFESSILMIDRVDVLDAARSELKALGVPVIKTPEGTERCIEELMEDPHALLLLDWGIGVAKAGDVLEATRGLERVDARPIFLFSVNEEDNLTGVAAEYGVAQLYVGQLTRNVFNEQLSMQQKSEGYPGAVKAGLEAASMARKKGNEPEAKELLHALHEAYPGIDRLAIDLAESCFVLGETDKAMQLLDPLIDCEEPAVRALNLYGRCQISQGRLDEATILLKKAKVINPFNIERLLQLGDAFMELGQEKRAIANYQDALKHDPNNSRALGGLGKGLLVSGEINEALVFLKQLSGPREMASVFNSAAVLAMRSGRYAEGMELYKVALNSITKAPLVHAKLAYNMGIGFFKKKDFKQACRCFEVATKLDPNNEKAESNFASLKKNFGTTDLPSDSEALVRVLIGFEITRAGDGLGDSTVPSAEVEMELED